MAKKGSMKRPAAAAAPAAKRGRAAGIAPELAGKCKSIADALKGYEALPPAVTSVMGSILEGLKTSLEEEKAKYQAVVEGADSSKLALAEAEKDAGATLETYKAATVEAKAQLKADEDTVKELKGAVAAAKKAQSEGDAGYVQLEQKKAELDAALQEMFLPMKEKPGEPKSIKTLYKVGKTFMFESSMLDSACGILKEEPEKRGTFGNMVVTQFEEALNKKIADMASELETLMPAKAEHQAAVEAKETELAAAEMKAAASKEAYVKACAAETAGEQDLSAKKKASKSFLPEIKTAADNFDKAVAAYDEFMSGPMKAFSELKDLAPPPEPEPVPEVPEVATAEPVAEMPEVATAEPVAEVPEVTAT